MKTALLFGSSGLIGGQLLNNLIQNNDYNKIRIFVRSEPEIKDSKIEIIKTDFNNIKNHAEATSITIKLISSFPEIILRIEDNGKGFDVESKSNTLSLGLKTLFERAKIIGAKMKLISEKSNGTTLTLNLTI